MTSDWVLQMQLVVEPSYLASIIAGAIASVSGIYLLNLWRTQEKRLPTDLPLFFGISFTIIGINVIMMAFMNIGVIPDTMPVFRFRTLFLVSGSVLPLFVAIFHIWFPRYKRYFKRVFALIVAYWALSALLGSTEEIIMLLLVPPMIFVIFAVVVTFIITWKTGRLREVRSELIVFSGILISIGQVGKITLAAVGMVFVADILTAVGIILGAIGLANPWYRRKGKKQTESIQSYMS